MKKEMEKQSTREGIFVAIRMRSMNERELKSGHQPVFRCSTQVRSFLFSFYSSIPSFLYFTILLMI